jgi:hypothetical protein
MKLFGLLATAWFFFAIACSLMTGMSGGTLPPRFRMNDPIELIFGILFYLPPVLLLGLWLAESRGWVGGGSRTIRRMAFIAAVPLTLLAGLFAIYFSALFIRI